MRVLSVTLVAPALAWLALAELTLAHPAAGQERGRARPAPSAAADTRPTFTVGSATAARGQTAYGAISVPAGSDSGMTMPVAVIHGARPGPVIAFVAGSHGTEYASVVALTRLIGQLDAKTLAGTVIVAPLLNVPSFDQMIVHVNPVDRKGMNAQYPGDAAGTQTQRALALVTRQVVEPADVVVDLHGGDLDEDLRPYSYWIRTGNTRQDSASRALAMAFGLDHIIIRDINVATPASTRSLSGYALSKGKTTFVAEAGRSGTVDPRDVDALVDGALNVLGALKVLEMMGHAGRGVAHPVWLSGAGARVAADSAGMFFAAVGRGTYVARGSRVGYTTDYLGRATGDVLAPVAGVVTFIRGVPSMWKGATLVNIAPVFAEPPPYATPAAP
ncbi:MAG: succinylglutamate desuccinylase/aspartoacylase family protein [Gemmatimonadaceae bacterium]